MCLDATTQADVVGDMCLDATTQVLGDRLCLDAVSDCISKVVGREEGL